MIKLSSNYLLLLLAVMGLGLSSCDDDDDAPNNPVIGTTTDIVQGDPNFSSLATALERTGLDATLDVPTANVTVFAPDNAAFTTAGIDAATIDVDVLRNVLLYHVISGNIQAAEIADGESTVTSLNTTGAEGSGLPIFVSNAGGTISLGGAADNSATVTTADIPSVNGTIHVINDVLIPPTIVDRALRDGRFSTLLAAATRAGLAGTLSGPGTFTLFAPTDDAFAAIGIDLDAVSNEDLAQVLLYHVLGTTVGSGEIAGGASFPSTLRADGPDDRALSLLVNNADDAITLNGDATVVVPDVSGNNGVVHAIDKVLLPQNIVDFVVKSPGLDSLEGAVVAADLAGTLSGEGPFTVFAPVDGGFAAVADTVAVIGLPRITNILTYHVVGSSNIVADTAIQDLTTLEGDILNFSSDSINTTFGQTVVPAVLDIQSTNGIIHLVPSVLLPADF